MLKRYEVRIFRIAGHLIIKIQNQKKSIIHTFFQLF